MKKISFIILSILWCSKASAQINKGAWLIGANSNLGYNSYTATSGGSSQSIFNLGAKTGYFIANNVALGANLGYFNVNQSGISSRATTIGFFARFYFAKSFFAGVGANSVSTTESSGSFSTSTSSNVIPFEFGYAAFVTKFFAIEPSLNYVQGDKNGGVTFSGIPVGAKSSFGLNVGLNFYINRE